MAFNYYVNVTRNTFQNKYKNTISTSLRDTEDQFLQDNLHTSQPNLDQTLFSFSVNQVME